MNLKRIIFQNFNLVKDLDLGQKLFLLGIFFLPSAVPIGALFLLVSIFFSFINNKENLLKNKWNFIFLVSNIIILIGTIYNCFFNSSPALVEIKKSIIWLNLFNWIPIYFAFLGFQFYLKTKKQILIFQKVVICGTIPVIISCILQKFLAIYGPFDTLFGTIVWFNYNIAELPNAPNQRVTGLFNNPNYLGMWLSLCLPFGISLLKLEKRKASKIILYIINIFIIYFAIATNSRNALLGILISILLIFGIRRIIYFSFFVSAGLVLFNILLPNFINFNDSYLYTKLVNFNLIARMNIWQNAINLIYQQPLLGWGAGTFPYLNKIIGADNYQHTHNLFIELALNFGIPLALVISSTVFSIFIKSFNKIKRLDKSSSKYSIYTSFFASFFVILVAHISDVTYYDGRISIFFAILLAGFTNFIEEKNYFEKVEIDP